MRTSATVHALDFSQLSGHEFERLVFAFLLRRWAWTRLDWYGQVGDDDGRDIWGLREDDWGHEEQVVVACANWRSLTTDKAIDDVDKAATGPKGLPHDLILVAGGRVSPDLKSKATTHASAAGIRRAEVWSGPEFEELLRLHADSVLRRFFAGEALPDGAEALRDFVADTPAAEAEGLRLLARAFDRPAFYTPFRSESSLPAFRRAISDTIEAINTGIYRSRDGTIIGRLPSKNDFRSQQVRGQLDSMVRKLNRLRVIFDDGIRNGSVQPCGCHQPDCPVYMVQPEVARDLDRLRRDILASARRILPGFVVRPDY